MIIDIVFPLKARLNCYLICHNPNMKAIEAIRKPSDIAFSQRGLFTTAQAQHAGVERYAVSRLEKLPPIVFHPRMPP